MKVRNATTDMTQQEATPQALGDSLCMATSRSFSFITFFNAAWYLLVDVGFFMTFCVTVCKTQLY